MPDPQLQSIDDILGPPPKQSIEDILGPAPGGPPPGKPGSPAIAAAYPNASVTSVATPQLAKAASEAGGPTQPTPMAPPAPTDLSTQLLEKQGEAGLAGKYALTPPAPSAQEAAGIPQSFESAFLNKPGIPIPQGSQQVLQNTYGKVPGALIQGAGEFAQGLTTPKNMALMGGLGGAGGTVQDVAGYVFAGGMLDDIKKQSPALWQNIKDGNWSDAAKRAEMMGLSGLTTILIGKQQILGDGVTSQYQAAADNVKQAREAAADNTPLPNQADVKAATAVPPNASEALRAKIAYQAEQDEIAARVDNKTATQAEAAKLASNQELDKLAAGAGWDPMLPKPHDAPQTAEGFALTVDRMKSGLTRTPAGDNVKPNTPVDPSIEQAVQEELQSMGADPQDPQSIADVLADAKGIDRPTIRIDPELQVSQTKGDSISIPVDAPATAIVHELEHAGDRGGANFAPPEGDQNDTALRFLLDSEHPDRGQVLLEKAVPGITDWADSDPYRYTVAGQEYATDFGGGAKSNPDEFDAKLGKLAEGLTRFVTFDQRSGSPDWAKDAMGDLVAPTKAAEGWMVANKGIGVFERKFSKLTLPEQTAFTDRMNTGGAHPEGWMNAADSLISKTNDYWYNQANERKPLSYRGGLEDSDPEADGYFRTIWKGRWDGGAPKEGTFVPFKNAPSVAAAGGGPQGTMGFFKQWSGKTPSELIAAGFEPVSYNPMTMAKMGIADKARFVGMWDGMAGAVDAGGIVRVPRGTAPPAEFVPVQQFKIRNFLDMMSKEKPEIASRGDGQSDYWMEPNFARMLDNYTSKNVISGTVPGQAALWWKAASTAWELAGSLPHLFNTMNISSSHMLASSLTDLWTAVRGTDADGRLPTLSPEEVSEGVYGGKSDFERRADLIQQAAGKAVQAMIPPLAAARYIEKGGQLYRAFGSTDELLSRADLGDLAGNPFAKKAFDGLFQSGGGLLYNETNTMDSLAALREALATDQNGRAIAAAVSLGGEKVSQAIMTQATMRAVSQMKLYAYLDSASQMLEASSDKIADGTASERDLLRKAWDHVDNLYGQIDYRGTWFWPKTFSSTMQLLLRAPGWRIGGLKAPVTGAKAAYDSLSEPIKLISESDEPMTMQDATPRADPRALFPVTALLPAVIWGSLYTYYKTGKFADPQSLKDLIFPQTGGLDDRGHPNRIGLFGYPKDWYNYANNPFGSVKNMASGIIGRTVEALNNKDFYGKRLYEPTDDTGTKFVQGGMHALSGMPFAAQGIRQSLQQNEDRPTPDKIMGVVTALTGNRPAPVSLDNTSAEDMIDQIIRGKRSEIGVATDVFDNRNLQRQWVQKLRDSTPETKQKVLNDIATSQPQPGQGLLKKTLLAAQMPPGNGLFSLLSWDEMAQVWDRTTPQEKQAWGPIFQQKLATGAKAIGRSNYPAMTMQKWQAAMAKLQPPTENGTPPAQ